MKCLFATLMASAALLAPLNRAVAFQNPEPTAIPVSTSSLLNTQININARYRIEAVSVITGAYQVSKALQRELDRLAGRPYRTETLDRLEHRIKQEFPGFKIRRSVSRGEKQDQLKVQFALEPSRKWVEFSTPRFAYHSQQGFSIGIGADVYVKSTTFNFGVITDSDEKLERSGGIRSAFLAPIGNTGFRFAFIAESFGSTWNRRTFNAASSQPEPLLYRSRNNFEPTVIYDAAPGLQLRAGLSFNKLEFQSSAAKDQAANAVFLTLRYSKQWQLGLASTKTLEAGYNLRAAANLLASDFDYRRHIGEAHFTLASGNTEKSAASVSFSTLAGGIDGKAPLLDRFVLGNTRTLRGWNRFDLAPLGADRVIHFSADGRYHFLRAVYDTGTLWNAGRPKVLRHSAGIGIVISGITAMVACPIRSGSIEPIFLVGTNF